jgi:hypothetical protein
MKRLLAAFLILGLAMVFTVGTPGCSKKDETKDKVVEKDKKGPESKPAELVKPKAPVEPSTLEEKPTPPPPPIPKFDDPKKPAGVPDLPTIPKLDLPNVDPKKGDNKGASLDAIREPLILKC